MTTETAASVDCTERAAAVAEAVARLRARGVEPHPAVLALYARYACGELSRAEVQVEMQHRAAAVLANAPRPHPNGRHGAALAELQPSTIGLG